MSTSGQGAAASRGDLAGGSSDATREPNPLRAEVDPVVCALSGYCVDTSPELFELGDDHAEPRVTEIGPELRAAALDAEAVCPTAAIRLFGL